MQTTHDFDIERLERVASGLNEVDTGVDAVVDNVHAVDLVLGIEVGIEALLDVLGDWAPGVVVVHEVAEAGGVDHSQAQANSVLFDIGADGLDVDSLGVEVERRLLALLGRVERGIEEGVDQSRLSEARLTYSTSVCDSSILNMRFILTNDHNVEVEALADTLAMPLVGQVGETDVACELPAHDVPHVTRRLSCGLRVPGGDGLRSGGAAIEHGVAVLDVVGRCRLAVRDGVAGDGRGLRRWGGRGCLIEHVSYGSSATVRFAGHVEALARRVLARERYADAQGSRVGKDQRVLGLD